MPFISVVMPAFNAEKTIESAISSVLSQTYCDFELIVVNDCSTDNTEKIINKFKEKDERIVYIKNEQNSGVSYSRNNAIKYAKGEWIAFLDSDDIWITDKLEKQINLIEQNPDVVLVYTASSFITANGEPFLYILHAEEKTNYKTLLRKNLVSCSSVMVKKTIVEEIKMPSDKMSEDYYVWLKILKKYQYAYGIDEPLLVYRLSQNSKSSSRIKSGKMTFNTYHAIGYSNVISFLLTCRYSIHSITKRFNIKRSKINDKI